MGVYRIDYKFLTKKQVDQFHEDGFLIANFNIEPELIDKILREVYPHYDSNFLADPTFPTRI